MQPAILDLTLHRGDDCRVRFLFKDGEGDPLPILAEELAVVLTWSGGTLTADALTVDEEAGTALWEITEEESAALPQGRRTRIELIRTNDTDGRRTYGVGYVTATDGEAPGDLDVGVTVQDLTVEITITAPGRGEDGVGVPAGGTTGQFLAKASGDDFDTEWVDPPEGTGGGEPGPKGDDGASAYEVAVANGFIGDETAWLASLVGPQGEQGIQGEKGETGDQGPQGEQGPAGADGSDGSDASVTAGNIAAAGGALVSDTINTQTGTTYTLQASDNGKVVELNNASPVTVTVPNDLAVGFNCILSQIGAGLVTVAAGSGATVNAYGGLKSPGQWGEMSLRVRANSGGSSAVAVLGGGVA